MFSFCMGIWFTDQCYYYYRMSQLLETVSRRPIPSHQKNIIFEINVEDASEEDIEVPYVMVKYRK